MEPQPTSFASVAEALRSIIPNLMAPPTSKTKPNVNDSATPVYFIHKLLRGNRMSIEQKREFLTDSAYQAHSLYTDPSSVLHLTLREFYDLDMWCKYWRGRRSAYKQELFPDVSTDNGGNENSWIIPVSNHGFHHQAPGHGGGGSRTFNIPYHPFSSMAMSNSTPFQPPQVHHHHYNVSNVHNGDNIKTKNVTTEGNGSTAVIKKLDDIQGGISDLKVASNDILATAKKASQPSREQFNDGDENLLAQDFLKYSTPTPRHLRFETSERAPPVSQSLAMGVPSQPQNL